MPNLALVFTIGFILFLLVYDKEQTREKSGLWVVALWFLIIASRRVSLWFYTPLEAEVQAGSLDSLILLALEGAALVMLWRRRVRLVRLAKENRWVACFFGFSLLSILWSNSPVFAFKGLIKDLGQPLMALVVLTDSDPMQATRLLLRRSAYLLIPFSIVLIKYFPGLGRDFSFWGGATNTGVTIGKNQLGSLCFLLGMYFVWEWQRSYKDYRFRKQAVNIAFLLMIAWLLWKASSATATVCLLLGIASLWILGWKLARRRIQRLGAYFAAVLLLLLVSAFFIDVTGLVVETTDREATFQGRQELWNQLLMLHDDHLLGAGYSSFWQQAGAVALAESFWWRPNQAHNGYLETYLNLGLVGLALLIIMLIGVFKNAQRTLVENFELGKLHVSLFTTILFYNMTEATFRGLHLLWFVVFLIGLTPPERFRQAVSGQAPEPLRPKDASPVKAAASVCEDPHQPVAAPRVSWSGTEK